jgi:hypothetical protein
VPCCEEHDVLRRQRERGFREYLDNIQGSKAGRSGEGRPLGLGSLHLWLSMPDHRTEGLSVTGDHCLLFSEVAT